MKDTDERACAYIAGPAPNRWGFTVDGKDLFESIRTDSTTEGELLPHYMYDLVLHLLDLDTLRGSKGIFAGGQPKSGELLGEEYIEKESQRKLRNHPLFFGITMGLLAEIINSR